MMTAEAGKPERPRWRRLLRVLVWTVVAGFILFLVALSEPWLIAAAGRVLLGWMLFLRTQLASLSPSPATMVSALVVTALAAAGLHLLAAAWRGRIWPDLPPWRVRWSVALTAAIMAAASAAMAVAGAAHQIAWLKNEPKLESWRVRSKLQSSAVDIAKQLERHADASGRNKPYPNRLDDVLWQRGNISALPPERLLLFQESLTATPEPWLYYGHGLNARSKEGSLLLAAPRALDGKRWIVLTPHEVKEVPEAEYQTLLRQREETNN